MWEFGTEIQNFFMIALYDRGMRVLLVEDEAAIAAVIQRGLESAHYAVETAADGTCGLEMAVERTYSLIILDIMLPGMNGWSICQALRARRDTTPILMLTARDEVEDRVTGLEMGADDYLPKPFAMGELLARTHALLRRDRVHRTPIIRVADLEIDTGRQHVSRAGRPIDLTRREYDLLAALAAREGYLFTRQMIQERVWMDDESLSNVVDVHVMALRRKVDADHPVKLIQTVHGRGYTLKRPEGDAVR